MFLVTFDDMQQTSTGDEAYNPDGLVQRSIRLLKDKFPDLVRKRYYCEFHFVIMNP